MAAVKPRYAPPLDPRAVARLRQGRVPADWLSYGRCRHCGPVLLPGAGKDYGELPECPWCLVRHAGGRLPPLAFVRARRREHWARLPEYFKTALPTPGPTPLPVAAADRPAAPALEPDAGPAPAADPVPASDRDAGRASRAGRAASATNELLASAADADAVGHISEVPHHPQDAAWIEAQLSRLPDPRRRAALRRRYGELYQAAFAAEPNPIRRDSRARFAANGDLRERVEALAGTGGRSAQTEDF